MPTTSKVSLKVSLESCAEQCKSQMVPLNKVFSYFCTAPVEEDALRRLLQEPVAAVPPAIAKMFTSLGIVLVPFLENGGVKSEENGDLAGRNNPRDRSGKETKRLVTFKRPAARRRLFSATLVQEGETFLFLAVKDEEVADCHYSFYSAVAGLVSDKLEKDSFSGFSSLVREELAGGAHGEIDDKSWRLKEQLVRRQSDPTRDTKLLRNYVRQALEDTLTLYMHGLCCDIDLEAGPRQLASRNIRRRLDLMRKILPPPTGFALFPEELNRRH